MKLARKKLGAIATVCLLHLLQVCWCTFLDARYAEGRTCSLTTIEDTEPDPREYCTFQSAKQKDFHGRVFIQFGESNCQFTMQSCMPGYCYAIRDFSAFLPRDLNITSLDNLQAPPVLTGIFKNASMDGAELIVTESGLAFAPTRREVTVTYSTKTCAEFYKPHGREYPQACHGKLGLLSEPHLLFAPVQGLDCKAGL